MSLCNLKPFIYTSGIIAVLYPLILATLLRNYVTKIFDPDLFNERYWKRDVENSLLVPMFKIRRAYLYLLAVGSNWAARRRFPDYDFRKKSPSILLLFSGLHFVALIYVFLVVIPIYFIKFTCA